MIYIVVKTEYPPDIRQAIAAYNAGVALAARLEVGICLEFELETDSNGIQHVIEGHTFIDPRFNTELLEELV